MDKLMKIKEVATKYKITKRTLRYYEEIGLIQCIRDESSNYRYYDSDELKKLEQIILLRGLDFNLSEIKEIILTDNDDAINEILNRKLAKIQDSINNLLYFKKVVSSIMKIRKEKGAKEVNFQEILKEQVYVNKKLERMIEMSQYVGDVIIVEFGENICQCAGDIINAVKSLRVELEKEYNEEIPLVRIRDVEDLKPNEYRILIKAVVVKSEDLKNINALDRANKIIDDLKAALVSNINTINCN